MTPPNQPKTPLRSVRVPDDLWEAAMARAGREATTVTAVVVAALRSYVDSEADGAEVDPSPGAGLGPA